MVFRLFQRRSATSTPQGELEPGARLYAIGDIHGRADLLESLLGRIEADHRKRGGKVQTRIVFLGDLIDRGPASAQVVQMALDLERDPAWRCQYLLGNHEEVFLQALGGDLKALAFFCRIGGRETIASYGISDTEYQNADYPELLELLRERVPQDHLEFLQRFEDLVISGDYAFVHAGIHPARPLASQKTGDLRWIRTDFLEHREALEKIIVHGHTISEDVELRRHRIGLDTGAYASGKLTAMGFEANERWVIDTLDRS